MEEGDISIYTSEGIEHLCDMYFRPLLIHKPRWYHFKLNREFNKLKEKWKRVLDYQYVEASDELKKKTLLFIRKAKMKTDFE